jgi:hypothetical protein
MWREVLADPKVRRAYVLTKVGVFVAAAVLTIPAVAPHRRRRSVIGLAVFGVLLLALTSAVLGMGTPADRRTSHG